MYWYRAFLLYQWSSLSTHCRTPFIQHFQIMKQQKCLYKQATLDKFCTFANFTLCHAVKTLHNQGCYNIIKY